MSRSYGQISCSIWDDDDDFAELSVGAQRTYVMLTTQKDLSACGTLALTVKRWAGRIRAQERHLLPEWLTELAAARFVGMDENTEELLIRTFVKWDRGYTNTKRLMAIHGASKALRSPILRGILAAEFVKLGLTPQFPTPDPVCPDEYPIEALSDRASDDPSDTRRVVVTYLSSDSTTHEPKTGNQEPGSTDSGKPDPPAAKSKPPRTRIPENFEVTPDMIRWARDRCPNITQPFLDLSTNRFIDHFENATRNAMKVNWLRTWQNWVETDYQRNPPGPTWSGAATNGHRRSTTDDAVNQTLEMARRYAEEDAAAAANQPTRLGIVR